MNLAVTTFAAAAGLACCAPTIQAQAPVTDTLPAAVVQRFVDGANARQLDSMMSCVAPSAVFGSLPENEVAMTGRDSVRAHYARVLGRLPAGHSIRVASRIADGAFVTDLELFANADGTPAGRATWVYYVAGGQIQRAWALRRPRSPRP